jgi:protease-4
LNQYQKENTQIYILFKKPLSKEELNLIRQTQLNIYDEFKQKIIDGRKIDPSSLEEIAQGKIWLGDEALKNGLIDEIGSLETTIKALALNLSLPEYEVIEIVKPLDPKELFSKIAGRITQNSLLNDLNTLDQNIEYIKSNHKQVLTLMPYDLELK